MIGRSLLADRRGNTVVEFALIAPTFLMFLFVILDGGRMMFTKQALNELAAASARCWAIKATGCTTKDEVPGWAVARGLGNSNLSISSVDVSTAPTTCNGQSNMAQVTVHLNYKKSALALLPQSSVPSQMASTACFPVAPA